MNLYETIMKNFNSSDESAKELAAILALEDEKFDLIAPMVIEGFKASLNSPEIRIAMKELISSNNLSQETINQFINGMDEYFKTENSLSTNKKDFLKEIIIAFFNTASDDTDVPNKIINIPIELCNPDTKLPTYATNGSAAMDLYSPEEFTLAPGETKLIDLGFKVNIPAGYALLIQPRSGLSLKTKLRVANSLGLIDSDYHESIGLIIENISNHIISSSLTKGNAVYAPKYGSSFTIGKGERCAQMRLVEVPTINWIPVNNLGIFENDHGAGFGSTGKE